MSKLIDHPLGNYSFLTGIAPYSCGVVAREGHEIVHVTLRAALPWREGFELIDRWLAARGLRKSDLCAIELRSERPFTMRGFIEFNAGYCDVLAAWGLLVDGLNPIARTNVCPVSLRAKTPLLDAFSFVRPATELDRRTFIVAGAGELRDGTLDSSGIVRAGETATEAIGEKARYVCDVMQARLQGLGGSWDDVTALDVYTIHAIEPHLENLLLARLPAAQRHGLRWHVSRPPVVDIEFEMDLRGVATELTV